MARSARVQLLPLARGVAFPSPADSNSPAHWNDLNELVVFTSFGTPLLSVGPDLERLTFLGEAAFDTEAPGGRWLESVIPAGDGTLYGYYHIEPADVCARSEITEPRIGAAVSLDDGQTWRDLRAILTAVPGSLDCDTVNAYFGGGVGDFSAILDLDKRYVYFFFTTYAGAAGEQGVSVARLQWAERDRPVGSVHKYFDGLWQEPGLGGRATSVFPAAVPWQDPGADSFWGPSLHWNTELRMYVMLLNHNVGAFFDQEGVYVAFASGLEDPALWSQPEQLVRGGDWYPQVIGLEAERGTDAVAGRDAWLCMRGACNHRIVFENSGATAGSARAGLLVGAPGKTAPVVVTRRTPRPLRHGRTTAR